MRDEDEGKSSVNRRFKKGMKWRGKKPGGVRKKLRKQKRKQKTTRADGRWRWRRWSLGGGGMNHFGPFDGMPWPVHRPPPLLITDGGRMGVTMTTTSPPRPQTGTKALIGFDLPTNRTNVYRLTNDDSSLLLGFIGFSWAWMTFLCCFFFFCGNWFYFWFWGHETVIGFDGTCCVKIFLLGFTDFPKLS